MKFKEKVSLACKDVTNRKFRSFLTIIAISVGSLLLVSMMGLGDAISNQSKKMVESFGVINEITIIPIDTSKGMNEFGKDSGMNIEIRMPDESSSDSIDMKSKETTNEEPIKENKKKITDSDLNKMSSITGVESVRASIKTSATSAKIGESEYVDSNINIEGVSFKYNKDFSSDILEGSNFSDNENEVLVGEGVLKKLGIENPNDAIGKIIKVKTEYPEINGVIIKDPIEVEGKIIGVTTKKSNYGSTLLMSDKLAEPLVAYYSNTSSYINDNGYDNASVFAEDGADVGEVSNKISKETGFMTFSMDLINTMLNVMTGVIKSILSLAGIIVLIVASLGLVNTMTMTLQEKKNMIGVMRAVGASRGNIRGIFVLQSLILGLAGGVLGAIISSVGIVFVNEYVTKSSGLIIPISSYNILLSIGITIVISLIAGLIPSGRAAKLDVVTTLSSE